MMRKIRTGVFETNSSSSHSICIDDKTFILDTLIPDADGVITIKPGQFGWEWKKYNDANAKASYCLTGTLYVEDRQIALDNIRSVIQTQTLCEYVNLVEPKPNIAYDTWDYIDHQSVGILDKILFDKDQLRQFIFNRKSWLLLGNDNDNYYWDLNKLDEE